MIAPGRVRCTADVYEWGMGADGSPAAYWVACDHISGSALPLAGLPLCGSCTTYAVRFCTDCSSPMCDDHSLGDPRRWFCVACRRREEEAADRARLARREKEAAEQRARELEYRSLPGVDRATMASYLRGRTEITDGGTHQLWEWTYHDIATVVVEDLGLSMPLSMPDSSSLNADGTVTEPGRYVEGRTDDQGGSFTTRVVRAADDRIGIVPPDRRLESVRWAAQQGFAAQQQARQNDVNRRAWRLVTWTIVLIFLAAVVSSIIIGIVGS